MNQKEYKRMVESRYGKPLKEIMHELIVERFMDQWEGSKELEVPKEVFVKWRTQFRLGPMQRSADFAILIKNKEISEYKAEMESLDIEREFQFDGERSLRGFKEVISRMLEIEKQRRILSRDSESDLSVILQIGILESTISNLELYEKNKLMGEYENRLQLIKIMKE